jgi:hypothetical protein
MPEIVEHISLVIGVLGLTVILWSFLLGVLRLVRLEWASLGGRDTLVEHEDLRHHLRLHARDGGHLHRQVSSDATTVGGGKRLPPFLQRGADDRPFLP